MLTTEKQCQSCHAVYPLAAFNKESCRVDGLNGRCKTCTRADSKRHAEKMKNMPFPRIGQEETHKECRTCHSQKSIDCFNKNIQGKDGYAGSCKECRHAYENTLRATPEVNARLKEHRSTPEAKLKAFALNLKKNYSLTPKEYETILTDQDGGCAICGNPPKTKRLGVDHCHKTGLIRGLLCAHCNIALGKFKDSDTLILNAAKYITNPPATKTLGEPRFGIKGRVNNKAKTKRRLNPERYKKEVSHV